VIYAIVLYLATAYLRSTLGPLVLVLALVCLGLSWTGL
jgi:hypothetical protein